MARLRINDGYTLKAETKPLEEGGPTVAFEYRPAMPEAVYDWQQGVTRASTGAAELEAVAKLVVDHVVSWDVEDGGKPAKIDAKNVAAIPVKILDQIVASVLAWAPKQMETDAGN